MNKDSFKTHSIGIPHLLKLQRPFRLSLRGPTSTTGNVVALR
jgi:hypothetical protein